MSNTLAARAARAAAKPTVAATAPAPAKAPAAAKKAPAAPKRAAEPRTKPVRITTDLAPKTYRVLQDYCAKTARALSWPKVPHAEVIRALIAELGTNAELQATVRNAVNAQSSK